MRTFPLIPITGIFLLILTGACKKDQLPPEPEAFLFELKYEDVPEKASIYLGPNEEIILHAWEAQTLGWYQDGELEYFEDLNGLGIEDIQVKGEEVLFISKPAEEFLLGSYHLYNAEIEWLDTLPVSGRFLQTGSGQVFIVQEQLVGLFSKTATIYTELAGNWEAFTITSNHGDNWFQFGAVVQAMVEDQDGRVWFGTTKGLYSFEQDSLLLHEHAYVPAVFRIQVSTANELWMETGYDEISLISRMQDQYNYITSMDGAIVDMELGDDLVYSFRSVGIDKIFARTALKSTSRKNCFMKIYPDRSSLSSRDLLDQEVASG